MAFTRLQARRATAGHRRLPVAPDSRPQVRERTSKPGGFRSMRLGSLGLLLSVALSQGLSPAVAATEGEGERWSSLKQTYFDDRPIIEDDGVIMLQAPERAYDAAVVPITMVSMDPGRPIRQVHLLVDQNPLPLAGIFRFEESSSDWESVETRIRIHEYTTVRAIGELSDGSLHMTSAFVKAAGGCSAPALADLDAAMANAGKMRLFLNQIDIESRQGTNGAGDATERGTGKLPVASLSDAGAIDESGARAGSWQSEAVIKISHPNNSGMQFDQISRNYIPAFYIHTIGAQIDGKPLVDVETNFSLSENPVVDVRFRERVEPSDLLVYALDSKGNRYEQTLAPDE